MRRSTRRLLILLAIVPALLFLLAWVYMLLMTHVEGSPRRFGHALEFVSETAQYGDYVSGPRVIDAGTKARMKDILTDIQDGTFTKNWIAEYEAGLPNYNRFKKADMEHPIEVVGKKLRAKMVWLSANASQPDADDATSTEKAAAA